MRSGKIFMYLIHKTLLGSFFILSPLSAAIAAETLPTITVTANRTETEVEKTLAAVTVIDREQIERQQFTTLQDLLRTVPGITYTNAGGMGQPTGISIRGTSSSAVLVLVDGQKIGSATLGDIAFQDLPIEQIERVEVVRGPRSGLYGSEAIGGVIQIFTRKGSENGVKPFASVTYGSHETYQGNVGVNVRHNDSWVTLNVAGTQTQGINTSNIDEPYDLDKDSYENKSISLTGGHQFNNKLEVQGNVLIVRGNTESDSNDAWGTGIDSPNVHSKVKQNVYGLTAKYKPFDIWVSQLQIGRSEDKQKNYMGIFSEFNTARDTLSWLNTLHINPNNKLMLGFDYQNDEVSGTEAYAVKERNNNGYFAQYLGSFGAIDLQGTIRLDDNEQFGNHTTGGASIGYNLTDNFKTYFSYGTAYRAPTFNDLYYPEDIYGNIGNPNVRPEESENYEIGFKGQAKSVDWELNAFYNEIQNLIAWTSAPTIEEPYRWIPSNVNQARIQGIEAHLSQTLNNWTWDMNYTYQDPENRSSGSNEGKQIKYRAKQLFNLSVDYTLDKWIIGGSVHAEDKRYTNDGNSEYLGSFATVDTRVTYQATPEFSIQAKLANLFDKEYSTNYSNGTLYSQDGRTAWVTLRYAMK